MFHMNQATKVVLTVESVDFRKSYNGLYAMACGFLLGFGVPEKVGEI